MVLTKHFKLHYWPGLTFGLTVFTIIVSYLIGVLGGHVYGFFPYVSDTGTIPPESCYFGQLFNFVAVCLGITHYIRYRQVDIAIDNGDIRISKRWNTVALWLSFVFALGTTIVANFQETAILGIHIIGATMTFSGGGSFYAVQTRISYATVLNIQNSNPTYGITRLMLYLRTAIVLIMFPLFFMVGICGMISLGEFKGKHMYWWTEKDGGYRLHLVATFSEWIYIILMLVYIVTFTKEFKSIKYSGISFSSLKNSNNGPLTSEVV